MICFFKYDPGLIQLFKYDPWLNHTESVTSLSHFAFDALAIWLVVQLHPGAILVFEVRPRIDLILQLWPLYVSKLVRHVPRRSICLWIKCVEVYLFLETRRNVKTTLEYTCIQLFKYDPWLNHTESVTSLSHFDFDALAIWLVAQLHPGAILVFEVKYDPK